MATPLNTGPGGFGIDGNQELFDTGLPEPANPTVPYGPRKATIDVSAAFVDASGAPKDLTKVTKTTLAQYLSGLTKGTEGSTPIANEYPIDPGYNSESITTTDGNPGLQTPGAPAPENTVAFAPQPSDLTSLSQNFKFIQSPDASSPLRKGKGSFKGTDGNDLLPGIPGTVGYTAADGNLIGDSPATIPAPLTGHPDTTGVIAPYVSAVLSKNRFTSAASAFSTGPVSNAGFNPNLTQQTKLGSYDPNAPTVSLDQLATIGPLLTLRAGLTLGSTSPGADPNSGALQASALLPGLAQLGATQVNVSLLEAADVLKQLTTDELNNTNVLDIGSESWGSLNNVNDPYSGTDAVGMLTLALALVAAVEVAFAGLEAIIGLITPQIKQPTHDALGRYTLGQYFANQKNPSPNNSLAGSVSAASTLNFGALLGIQPTTYPFSQAMSTGLDAFFQQPTSTTSFIIGIPSAPAMDSPGYYSVVARAIIRSGITIVDQLKRLGSNVISDINVLLSLIDIIRSSKIVAAMNVFAILGDAVLSAPTAYVDANDPTGTKVSAIDSYSNFIPAAEQVKSRLQGSLKLAWASNRAAANLVLPSSLLVAGSVLGTQALGQFNPFMGIARDPYSYVNSTVVNAAAGGRIDSITANTFEQNLESSYVPFYFHDIRTNEMIAFHAFIASITDDYNASYDKSEGLGRVEPVKIYKNTERRINLSFYIAATSPLDFDDMWTKINKLVTLVYPQYTQGTQVADATGTNYVFTQPFSQLVGASPLVRVRLGDLFRSNYTPFALGRLFGLGNQDFRINGQTMLFGDSMEANDVNSLASSLQTLLANPAGQTFLPAPAVYPQFVLPSGGGLSISLPSITLPGGLTVGATPGLTQATQFAPDGAYFQVVAIQTYPGKPDLVVGTVQFRTDAPFAAYFAANQAALSQKYANASDPVHNFVGGTYVFPASALAPTVSTLKQLALMNPALADAIGSDSDFATNMATFLNPNNAIAKSFQDTGGKGLAGFIESLSFDWYDKVTWETAIGSIAPKIVKVTIGFSPIHDISPGIDHQGFNRAPVYPVGIMGHDDAPFTPISTKASS